VLWSLPSKFLTGASAAAGLAAINSVGNLGGFIAQNVVPWIRDATGSTIAPMLFLAACLAAGGLMTFFVSIRPLPPSRQLQPPPDGAAESPCVAHLRETDCVAGHVGLELRNPCASHVFEIS
jgi:hypothetical protein